MQLLQGSNHGADRLKNALLVAGVLLISLAIPGTATAVPGVAPGGDIGSRIQRMMDGAGIPGMSVAILNGGRVTFSGNFGVADSSDAKPVSDDTVFFAASLSKPLFAYAVLRLAERGVIDLDEPLYLYLPNPRLSHDQRYRRITARMVLSHTSGLPNWSDGGKLELSFDPGSDWQYSGEGFIYLQRVVERLVGKDLDSIMQAEVFRPLGMEHSSFYARTDLLDDIATGHDLLGRSTTKARPTRENMNPAGTLLTNASDYALFLEELLSGRNSSRSIAMGMATAQAHAGSYFGGPSELPVNWGLGFGLEVGPDGTNIWQWGDNLDCRNFVMANPASGKGVVMFCNSENGMAVARQVTELALEGPHHAFEWLPFADSRDQRFIARRDLARAYVMEAGTGVESIYKRAAAGLDGAALNDLVVSLGRRLLRDGRQGDAISLLEMHARNNPRKADAQDLLAGFYLSTGQSRQALETLRRGAELDPGNAERQRTIDLILRQL